MLLLYILWDDRTIFMISGLKEHLQQQLEYTLLKPDCHSWRISKMQSGREDTLEELYAIKLCFKLGKNTTETYGMLQNAFWPGVGGVRMSIDQSWLAKGLGLWLGLLWRGCKGVHEEIPSEEASTLQIGSVAFLATNALQPGEITSKGTRVSCLYYQ